jgi:hypothetical protein
LLDLSVIRGTIVAIFKHQWIQKLKSVLPQTVSADYLSIFEKYNLFIAETMNYSCV